MKKNAFVLPDHGYDATRCPACGGLTATKNTAALYGGYKIRYRTCKKCGRISATVELRVMRLGPEAGHGVRRAAIVQYQEGKKNE